MPPSREPWIKIRVGARRSDKLAALPSDSARLGYFYLLIEAKLQRDMGEFAGLAHLREVLGRHGRYAQDYIDVGVVHVAPLACEECRLRHAQIPRGRVVVHDFRKDQRDPTAADRQDDWRDRNADRNGVDNADRNGIRNADRNADQPAPHARTPSRGHPSTQAREGIIGSDTQDGPAAEPQHARNGPVRNADRNGLLTRAGGDGDGDSDSDSDESLPKENRSPSASRDEPRQRADVAALLDRGWKRVTAAQRRVLDEVLDRHDVTGPEWAASIIRATPPDDDPLAEVLRRDQEWQAGQRAQAERDDAEWQRQKAADRESAGEAMAKVAEVFG